MAEVKVLDIPQNGEGILGEYAEFLLEHFGGGYLFCRHNVMYAVICWFMWPRNRSRGLQEWGAFGSKETPCRGAG